MWLNIHQGLSGNHQICIVTKAAVVAGERLVVLHTAALCSLLTTLLSVACIHKAALRTYTESGGYCSTHRKMWPICVLWIYDTKQMTLAGVQWLVSLYMQQPL